jgi:hypothetical protein
MFTNKKIKTYIKRHPEILETDNEKVSYQIDEDKIPDIDWLFERPDVKAIMSPKPKAHWYSSKKFIIAVTVILLFVAFMIATPVGSTVADAVYKTIIQSSQGEISVQHGQNSSGSQLKVTTTEYSSIEELRSVYSGKIAHSTKGTLEKIELSEPDFAMVIDLTYSVPGNRMIFLTQTVSSVKTEWSGVINSPNGKTFRQKLKDGTEVVGYVTEQSAYATAYKDYMFIELYAENISYESFMDFLNSISID